MTLNMIIKVRGTYRRGPEGKIISELFGMFPDCRWIDMPDYLTNGWVTPGYLVRKDHVQFCTSIPTPYHEVAHMVEMQDFSRLVKDDWGITSGPNIPVTANGYFKAVAREARVRGIQWHLCNLNNPTSWDGSPLGIKFNNDYWFAEGNKFLPFGRFKEAVEIRYWADNIVRSTAKAWSVERIVEEWKVRVAYIRNWQETKERR